MYRRRSLLVRDLGFRVSDLGLSSGGGDLAKVSKAVPEPPNRQADTTGLPKSCRPPGTLNPKP